MVGPMDVILGFDPGGKTGSKFGWCICQSDTGQLRVWKTGRSTNAKDALEKVSAELPPSARVIASGIDAPMFWTNTGERRVDSIIRDAGRGNECPNPGHQPPAECRNPAGHRPPEVCPNPAGHRRPAGCPYPVNVQEINSLWGACLAQGVLLGSLLHGCRRFDAPITEAHPKALLCLLGKCRADLGKLVEGVEKIPCPICRPDPKKPVQVAKDKPCPAEDQEDAVLAAYAAWSMHKQSRGWRDLLREERNYVLPFDTPVSYWMPIP